MKAIIRDDVLQSDMIAIADDKGNKVTYRELAEKAERLSEHIDERSLVFVLCDKQMETLEFIYEIMYLNRVPLLLSKDMDKELLDELIEIYKPQYIYCRNVSENYSVAIQFKSHVLLTTGFERYPIHPDLALLLSTSGTTGAKKLVRLSYNNLYNNAKYACRHLEFKSGQKCLSPMPVNYTYGIAFCYWGWHCGATVLTTEELVIGNKFAEFFLREKVNNFAATPYTFEILDRIRFWTPDKLQYLSFVMSGGARMSNELMKKLVSLMPDKFWSGYGQTECTCIISATKFEHDSTKMGSIGKAFDNIEVIVDKETGELCIKSKSVCMGYAVNSEQLAEGDVNNGILNTGDVVSIDDDGYIFLRGRLTRYIKILGKRISLDDVEIYVKSKFQDAGIACMGEDGALIIFYSGIKAGSEDEIMRLLDVNLKIPKKFISCIRLEEIPVNAAGKINYSELKNFFE